jgi:hypothetical protein
MKEEGQKDEPSHVSSFRLVLNIFFLHRKLSYDSLLLIAYDHREYHFLVRQIEYAHRHATIMSSS